MIIKTTNLTKKYADITAVNNLNLEIKENEIFALLGVNGAGKTTTIKMLTCLTKPTSGNATILNYSILDNSDKVKEIIDVSMQETAIARKLTVRENVEFYAKLNGNTKEKSKEITDELINNFGLTSVQKKPAMKLSGGYQRRLSIALSIVKNPKVLFLDEPTLGLDVIARRELWKLIKNLKGNMTIILTTHYMEEAEALADRIGIMKDGKLLFIGTCEELFNKTSKNDIESAFISIVEGGANND